VTDPGRAAVRSAAVVACAGAVHAAVNARLLRRPDPSDRSPVRPVTVLVPARDEQGRIGPCVRALVGQDGVGRVVVLDDASSDGTADEAREAGAEVIGGRPLPPGWLGKPWACAQLAEIAGTVEVLVFVDADVQLEPGAVAAALRLLRTSGLDIVCAAPRQDAVTAGERLVQPLVQWSWLTTLPLRLAERSRRPSLSAAIGQFVLVRRAALERAGGFAAVRGAVLDDLALVRAVKTAGGRGGVVDGSALARCRMYDGWPALRDGYGKSLWAAFGSPAGAVVVTGGLAVVYVLPALAALRGSRIGLLGYAAGVASRVTTARATGGRPWPDALAHPVSVLAFAHLTGRSLWLHRRGRLSWKGRPVDAAG
jgi:cellulose synthase/poly-beta-1,6-N-acetylglucosamine synthase-like glycosyltransferase